MGKSEAERELMGDRGLYTPFHSAASEIGQDPAAVGISGRARWEIAQIEEEGWIWSVMGACREPIRRMIHRFASPSLTECAL